MKRRLIEIYDRDCLFHYFIFMHLKAGENRDRLQKVIAQIRMWKHNMKLPRANLLRLSIKRELNILFK